MARRNPSYNTIRWLRTACDVRKRDVLIEKSIETLSAYRKQRGKKFDAIACCGYSGLLISTVLSYEMKIPLIVVRKNKSHDDSLVFGMENASKYIIVDDFVSSGKTVRLIHGRVSDFTSGRLIYSSEEATKNPPAKLLAVFTYERTYGSEVSTTMYEAGLAGASDPIKDVPLYDLRCGF